jgi:hypothetical protein
MEPRTAMWSQILTAYTCAFRNPQSEDSRDEDQMIVLPAPQDLFPPSMDEKINNYFSIGCQTFRTRCKVTNSGGVHI